MSRQHSEDTKSRRRARAELDALLRRTQDGVLAKITEALDLEAGLAAIVGPDATEQSLQNTEQSLPELVERAWGLKAPGIQDRFTSGWHSEPAERAEVTAICEALTQLIELLTPDDPAPFYVTSASQPLAELRAGLSRRELTRAAAEDLIFAALGKLAEAMRHLTGTMQLGTDVRGRPGGRPVRRGRLERSAADVEAAVRRFAELYPRIMRLFADAERTRI
jgi:hypothetical protein